MISRARDDLRLRCHDVHRQGMSHGTGSTQVPRAFSTTVFVLENHEVPRAPGVPKGTSCCLRRTTNLVIPCVPPLRTASRAWRGLVRSVVAQYDLVKKAHRILQRIGSALYYNEPGREMPYMLQPVFTLCNFEAIRPRINPAVGSNSGGGGTTQLHETGKEGKEFQK